MKFRSFFNSLESNGPFNILPFKRKRNAVVLSDIIVYVVAVTTGVCVRVCRMVICNLVCLSGIYF